MKDKKQLGFLGLDQYGEHYTIKANPRKELCEQLGRKHVSKMYCDPDARHVGYIIAGRWINIYRICEW